MENERDQLFPVRPDGVRRDRLSRRRLLGLGTGALATTLLAACGGGTTPPATSAPKAATTPAAGATTAPAPAATTAAAPAAKPAAKGGGAFHGAWPYQVPPEGHFNSLAGVQKHILGGGSGAGSIYRDI